MARLFSRHARYATALPAFAVRQQLEQLVQPPFTGWRRWLGLRPPCRGVVAADTFRARVAHGRSDGPLVQGHWEPTPHGSLVELTVSLTIGSWIGVGIFLLWCLFIVSLTGVFAHPARLLSPAGFIALLVLLFSLFILADLRWSLRRAQRYFENALQLTKLSTL
jgi:hypothetical protein